jgi:hypothetical protein
LIEIISDENPAEIIIKSNHDDSIIIDTATNIKLNQDKKNDFESLD